MADRPGSNKEAEETAETAAKLLAVVKDLAAELHPRQTAAGPVTLDSALDRDLGFDSLGLVELLVRIERAFEVFVPEQVLASAETPRDLLRAVLGAEAPSGAPPPAEIKGVSLGEAEAAPFSAGTLVEVLEWHVRAHETVLDLVCRLLLEKKNNAPASSADSLQSLSYAIILYRSALLERLAPPPL